MTFQRTLIIGSLLVCLVFPRPTVAADRADVVAQLADLLAQIQTLQALIIERTVDARPVTVAMYDTEMFTVDPEAVYAVSGGSLQRLDNQTPRAIDVQLFTLFRSVVGAEQVDGVVTEWRVFSDGAGELGGFIEQRRDTRQWVVGVNRSGYEPNNIRTQRSYADLFLHEYAHVLVANDRQRLARFTERFWSRADNSHAAGIQRMNPDDRFDRAFAYFARNEDRFVSEYATHSPEEDLAETFVRFVREDRPAASSLVDRKVRYFYEYADWQLLRQELRSNLRQLRLLE